MNLAGKILSNTLGTAIRKAAKDSGEGIYHFLENTPKTSLTCHLVQALNELGYSIVKTPD